MNNPIPLLSHYRFPEGQMVLFETHTIPAMPEPRFGMHLSPEVGVVLSGCVARYAGGVCHTLGRGGLSVCGVLEPHGFQVVSASSRTVDFILRPDFLFALRIPGVDSSLWHVPFNTLPKDRPMLVNEEFARLAEALIAARSADDSPALQSARIQMTLLNILLLAHAMGQYAPRQNNLAASLERLRPALELIHRSRAPVSTAEAARMCRLSPSRFSQLFAAATGLSFSRYSLRYRLEQVAHDLATTDCLLDELADKWGFSDKSHLAVRFREHYRTTPGAYRKSQGHPAQP